MKKLPQALEVIGNRLQNANTTEALLVLKVRGLRV